MDYLIRAEKYAAARGDESYFKHHYNRYRDYYNVNESVWKTLSHLYSDEVADSLEFQ